MWLRSKPKKKKKLASLSIMRAHVIDLRPEFATSAKIFPSSSSLRFSLATDTLPSWMSLSLNSRSNLFKRKPLFVISVLALEASMAQGYKSDASHCANPDIAGEDVPTSIKNLVSDILKVYSTKDETEQANIVNNHYSEEAHFVDPLMDVKTPREINLAFLSLIKLFSEVKVEQKSISLNPKPRLPSSINAGSAQQFLVNNRQLYKLERSSAISRCMLPGSVDLDVNTYLTISPESGRVIYHEDVWNNKGFGFPGFLKPGNGVLSSWAFKLAGWGKEVDKAKFKGGN